LHEELMARVLDRANLQRAWKRVKANKGAPGIDGMCIEDFTAFAQSHWPSIRQQLADGTYQPQPVRRVCIPKPQGGERLLGIPTVTDRVIQQAIAQVLTPIFDPDFSESSFGFRPGRCAHGALRQVQSHIKAGYRIAVDLDLAKFFDNVQHDVLMARVARKVRDQRLLALIGRYLRKTDDCEFLGFTFRGTKLRWSDRAFADFKHHVRRLTGRSRGVSMAYRLGKLAQYVRGWMGYFGISDYYRPIPEIDHWLRRRLRMCYWKQWRYVRTKVRNLLALGTFKRQAILTALSSKSYWRLSRTLATQSGMTNEWLKRQGLTSVRDRWMQTHGYA
jgi:RNA-directed DNA polymerase